MMSDLNRDDKPPKAGPRWWIHRVLKGEKANFVIFSRSIWGVWTHWTLWGSSPCLSERSKCHGCKNQQPKRWKGYLHVYHHEGKRSCFVEITPAVAEAITQQLGEGQPLRGYRLELVRGKGDKSRVKALVSAPFTNGPELIDEVCPEKTLRQLWRMNEEKGPDQEEEQ